MRQSGVDSMAWQAERIADSRLSIDAPIALLRRLLASFSIILDDTRNTEHVSPRVEKSTDEGRNMGCEFGEGGTSRPPPHVVPRCCPYRASISASAVSVHSSSSPITRPRLKCVPWPRRHVD